MKDQTLPKRVLTFCGACLLFVGSLYYFVQTTQKNAEAISHRTVPLELKDLVDEAKGI
ncbi:MAG: hypothetical protein Q8L64_05160 [bacterium]|nr:hypothetical protein [bacterium]